MKRKVSFFLIGLLAILFASTVMAETIAIVRSGASVNEFVDDHDAHSLNESIFDHGILLGDGFWKGEPLYKILIPVHSEDYTHITFINITIEGDNSWLSWPKVYVGNAGPYDLDNSLSLLFYPDDYISILDVEDNLVYRLDIRLDVGLATERYDLDKITVVCEYSNISAQTLENFQQVYSAYRMIEEYESGMVNRLWNTGAWGVEEYFYPACQKAIALADNLSGLSGSLFSATKGTLDAIEKFQDIVDILESAEDYLDFWACYLDPYKGDGPSESEVSTDLLSTKDELYALAQSWQTKAFDGEISAQDSIELRTDIESAKTEVDSLTLTLQEVGTASWRCWDIFEEGVTTAEIMLNSLSPLLIDEYEPGHNSFDTDSYIYALTDALDAQIDGLPPVGSLNVTINPVEVRSTARWRLTSGPDQNWKESGEVINYLMSGDYTLQFNEVTGWAEPDDQVVTISQGSNSKSGTYIRRPAITSRHPSSGPPGTYMKIEGLYFGSSGSVVFSGGVTGQILSWSDIQILCKVPIGAIDGDLVVRTTADSYGINFDVTNPTTIYVNKIHTPDIENGTLQYPFSTIQGGAQASTIGDEIIISADTYSEDVSCETAIVLHFTGDSKIFGQVTIGPATDILSDGHLILRGGNGPTTIYGSLAVSGKVFVINPAGILFGSGATVNANQLVASSLWMDESDFAAGIMNFYDNIGGEIQGAVENHGTIGARMGEGEFADLKLELAVLIGKKVINSGIIETLPGSLVLLTTGESVVFITDPDESNVLVQLDIDAVSTPGPIGVADWANVVNTETGEVTSPQGQIVLAAGDGFAAVLDGIETRPLVVGEGLGSVKQEGSLDTSDGGLITMSTEQRVVVYEDSATTNGQNTTISISGDSVYSYENLHSGGDLRIQTNGSIVVGEDLNPKGLSSGDDLAVISEQQSIYISSVVESEEDIILDAETYVMLLDDIVSGSNIDIVADTTFINGNLTALDGDIDLGTDLTGLGALIIKAGNDIILGGQYIQTAGNFILIADTDNDASSMGDVLIEAPVMLTSGSFTSSGVDFFNPGSSITAYSGNIAINHSGTVTLDENLTPNSGIVTGTATKVIVTPTGKIQDGIDVSIDGADVMVKSGTYTGPENRDISFKGKAITVRSEDGPKTCIIDCQQQGRGFNFSTGGGSDSVLDGFTIVNGNVCGEDPNSGGGVYCAMSSPTIRNCMVLNNVADTGSGVYFYESTAQIINCTIGGNTSLYNGGGVYCNLSDIMMLNCILWGNEPEEIYLYESTPTVTYCDIEDGWEGDGNIDVEPEFVDAENGDYHLKWGSACVDAGDPTFVSGEEEVDIDGEPRVMGGRVDMGADEVGEKQVDFTRDGRIDISDLSVLSGAWDTMEGEGNWYVLSDLFEDGVIGLDDLVLFVGDWMWVADWAN